MNSFRNIYNSNLSHRARSVYMYLKDRADSEGRCWPAIRTIALELGLSRSTVKRRWMTSVNRSAAKVPTLAGKRESYFQSVSCGMTEVSNAG